MLRTWQGFRAHVLGPGFSCLHVKDGTLSSQHRSSREERIMTRRVMLNPSTKNDRALQQHFSGTLLEPSS